MKFNEKRKRQFCNWAKKGDYILIQISGYHFLSLAKLITLLLVQSDTNVETFKADDQEAIFQIRKGLYILNYKINSDGI